ncbi:MAG TPA: secretin N-terminal domain-containing protein, partial [Candidatus Methylomirabilis sp.]
LPLLGVALALSACAPQLSQGNALEAAGRWDEAVAFYLEAVQRNRSDPEARGALLRALTEASIAYQREGEAQEKAGKLDEAKVLYERSLGYNAENAAARLALNRMASRAKALEAVARGRALLDKGAAQEAAQEAEAALLLVPELPEAQALLAEAKAALAKAGAGAADGESLGLFPDKPITLRFRDTDIKEVLEIFARIAGVNIMTDDAVGPKRITANFRDLPIREAFRLILTSNRFFARQVAPNTVVVVPDNPGKRQQYDELFVKTFYLTTADARVAVNLLRTILNTRQVFVNEKLNALVVRDTKEKLELARKLLEANDRGGAEVEIEVEVIEVDRTRLQDLGIQFSQSLTATLTLPTTTTLSQFRFTSFFGAGVLTVTNPTLTLNLLKNQGSTKILAHPTIRVLDRAKARLLIGERRPFQISQLTSVPATAGTTGATPILPTGATTTTETRVEYRDLGLKLTLTPTIHLNGEVTVEINFEISAVGAPIGGTLQPAVNTRNLDSFIKVRDGETRLLGGLFQDTETENTQKIPFLGDLPVIGRLFSDVRTDKTRTDVLVAITPRLVKTVERPRPDVELFFSGTGEAFGGPGAPVALPPPISAPALPPAPPAPAPGGPGAPPTPFSPPGGAPGAPPR